MSIKDTPPGFARLPTWWKTNVLIDSIWLGQNDTLYTLVMLQCLNRVLTVVVYVEVKFNCSEATDNDAINIKKVFTYAIVACWGDWRGGDGCWPPLHSRLFYPAIDIKALGELADKYAAHQNENEKRIFSWCICNLAWRQLSAGSLFCFVFLEEIFFLSAFVCRLVCAVKLEITHIFHFLVCVWDPSSWWQLVKGTVALSFPP